MLYEGCNAFNSINLSVHSIAMCSPFSFSRTLIPSSYNRLAISCVNNVDAWSFDNKLQLGD